MFASPSERSPPLALRVGLSSRVHQFGDLQFVVPTGFSQAAHDLFSAFEWMVLAQLPFAFETIDIDLKPDNRGEQLLDEVRIGRGHRPGLFPVRFVPADRSFEYAAQTVAAFDQPT
jgi:hypothetical protein